LFATLDPTFRQLEIPVIGKAILTDTVGFIRQLPHGLIDAFQATLEEVKQANLLLHIVDASATDRALHMKEVNDVLAEIGADKVHQLVVYNKIDLLDEKPRIDRDDKGLPVRIWLSGLSGDGLDGLLDAIAELVSHRIVDTTLSLSPCHGELRARLFALGAVIEEKTEADGTMKMHVKIEAGSLKRLAKKAGLDVSTLNLEGYSGGEWFPADVRRG
jgi:GTP-binding protein HflX